MDTHAVAGQVALLEREHEVERIRGVLRAAGRGDGAALMIEAAPGLGKSRLVEAARAAAQDMGLRVFHARATQLEQGFPFGVVRQLFERALLEAAGDERERWLSGAASLATDLLEGGPARPATESGGTDASYAWQHGLYWLACNVAADSPVVIAVDDLQWCDAPSARTLSFIARRLEGQPLAVVLATRPLDPALTPEAATLVSDPATEELRPAPLTQAAVGALVAARLSAQPEEAFVRACVEVTGGNPFLLGELLNEVAARGLVPTARVAAAVGRIVPRGVANGVLLRLSRLPAAAGELARALSVLDDGAQVGDAALLARLDGEELETAMTALVSADVVESGGTVRFVHPMLRAAIYGDQSPAERQRLHRAAAAILRERGAPRGRVAEQVMHTEPGADLAAVELLRDAAREALALGDPTGAAALLSRALDEPPGEGDGSAVALELGRAQARAGAPEAIARLSEIVAYGEGATTVSTAAIELSSMLLFAGRAAEGAAILRRARDRLPDGEPAREQLEVALLGISCTSASARRESDSIIAELRAPERSARGPLPATMLATLAMEEMMRPRSAAAASDLAERALAAGLPAEPHRAWTLLTLAVLTVTDRFDVAERHAAEILAEARKRGAALTVASVLAHRAFIAVRRGDLIAAETDAQAAIELASDRLGSEFALVLAAPVAVLAGLDRDEPTDSLRRLLDSTGIPNDTELLAGSQLSYASAMLDAAAGKHEVVIEQLRKWARDNPAFGSENPSAIPWRSASALALVELGRSDEARDLAADEVRRARSFGAPRALGIALRAEALVAPPNERSERLGAALAVLADSPASLEHARVLVDLGASFRAAGQRRASREPLLEGLALASRCGARAVERRARAELAAIGIRPRSTDRAGLDSLTPSERRVADLAAAGGTNREIAQSLFVTEKTVETHLGRAFRKLDISSRRQLPAVLAGAAE